MTRFGLHRTVLLLAATHCVVDGYGNIFAPLLPLLIPQLKLSLAAAGTLQMLFQMAASVSQLGFGYIADRWRPRVLLLVGPLIGVGLLPLIGLTTNIWHSRPFSFSAAWAERRFIHPRPRWYTAMRDGARAGRCRFTSPAAISARRWRRCCSRRTCRSSVLARRRG